MARLKKKNAVEAEPRIVNEHIHYIDLYFKNEYMKPGTLVKIKNDRAIYIFESMQCNSNTGMEWINLRSQSNGDWKSVRVDRLIGPFIKKSRAKKNV